MPSLLQQNFEYKAVDTEEGTVATFSKGCGHPLILLHGYPQTHATWEKVASFFSERFRCIVVDLPGYGLSQFGSAQLCRQNSSKRAVGAMLVKVMAELGHADFYVLGHDRGARVAYRMALDHPKVVKKLGIIEIVPTGDMWEKFNADMALKAYHWVFLAQPYPLPEKMIEANSIDYLEATLISWTKSKSLSPFSKTALKSYREQFRKSNCIHAMCEDYRAGVTFDRELDEEDRANGRKIECPLHFVWSSHGFPAETGDPLSLWSDWATSVTGNEVDAGHFPQEENSKATLNAFVPFFADYDAKFS
jgi:haloacetate dehalogenase